ncbi:MAG: ABC transporter substrate-binding protein [Clostridia bacterium]|nr:ABC transporter substrate-binding protein [Clostridia bacterium]
MKKLVAIFLTLLLFVFAGCSQSPADVTPTPDAPQNTPTAEAYVGIDINIGALKGPTGMGFSKLMTDAQNNKTANNYDIELFANPTDIPALLKKGELDIAAIPTNLAANLYNKNNGNVQLLALNTLGVLYVLENGNTVNSIKDLEGKTVYAFGKSATPEYALKYVLKQENVNCELEFFDAETLNTMAMKEEADIMLVPEPQVSIITTQNPKYRVALDFNKVWNEACDNSALLSMGCLAIRKDFAQENPKAVEKFLEEYSASVAFVISNVSEAASMIESLGIVPKAAIAKKAIPNCNIVAIYGDDMKEKTKAFLQILFESEPASIGNAVPGEDFYY